MKLKQVKILARMYQIVWIDNDHAEDANISGSHQQSWGDYKIKIAKKSKNPMETLLHEILHSLVFQLQIEERDFEVKNKCIAAVEMIGEQLLGILRENNINLLEELEEK